MTRLFVTVDAQSIDRDGREFQQASHCGINAVKSHGVGQSLQIHAAFTDRLLHICQDHDGLTRQRINQAFCFSAE